MSTRNRPLPHPSLEVDTDTAIVVTHYRVVNGVGMYTVRNSTGGVDELSYAELCIIENMSEKPTIYEPTFLYTEG